MRAFCRPPGFPLRIPESGLFPENVLFFCGKKRYNSLVICVLPCFAHIFRAFPVKFAITTYPRKGTVTLRLQCTYRHMRRHYNLSPQGDGNLSGLVLLRHKLRITTHPRKGTVTGMCHPVTLRQHNYNLSPQGDGNTFPLTFATVVVYYNLSPQGDGNLMRMSFPYFLPSITIYPRKGTVTDAPGYGCRRGQITTYPRKGTATSRAVRRNHERW